MIDLVGTSTAPSTVPKLAPEALYGLAGDIVRAIEPYTEADPAAVLSQVLVATGNLIGRGPHALVEKTMHGCNEFVALVGRSSKGRKGSSWSTPRWMLGQVDEEWSKKRIRNGLSSGEGVISHVRDAREEMQQIKEKGRVVDYQRVVVDEGEADKRLLIVEAEFATVLRRMQGETNSLSAVLREAWDSGSLSTLTKNSPLRATGAHISIIAHTTHEELVTSLTETDRANGFANRFLYMMVGRSKYLPEAIPVDDATLAPLITRLRQVAEYARAPRLLARDDLAKDLWAEVYRELSEGEPGLLGAVVARAEAHVLRLSLIYAVLDCAPAIRAEHLEAALAVWEFADASAREIFGANRTGLTLVDIILEAVGRAGSITRTEVRDLFKRNKSMAEIDAAISVLERCGKVRRTRRESGGRPVELLEATGL